MIALLNSTDILSSSFLSRLDGSDGWFISVEVELASFTTYNKVGATYENPLKSSWAVALGGIPGESEIAVTLKCTLLPRTYNTGGSYFWPMWAGISSALYLLPFGVFDVNVESKWKVSSGTIVGLKGGSTFFSIKACQLIVAKKGCCLISSTWSGPLKWIV